MSTPEIHPPERSNSRRTLTVIFIALLLLALTALAVKQFAGVDTRGGSAAGPTAASIPAEGADAVVGPDGSPAPGGVMVPGTSESDPAGIGYTEPPEGPIAGIDAAAVTGAWEKRWRLALEDTADLREKSTIVDYPAGGGRLHLILTTTESGAGAVSVRCIVEHGTKKVDAKLLEGVVRDCLSPALEQQERAEVTTWLRAQDYKAEFGVRTQRKSMTRFDLTADVMTGSLRVGLVGRP